MIYQGWYKTENNTTILLKYNTTGDIEINFINAVATAEMEADVIVILNDKGRRYVDKVKLRRINE